MTMYFHQRVDEVVLWRGWLTKTDGGCVGGGGAALPSLAHPPLSASSPAPSIPSCSLHCSPLLSPSSNPRTPPLSQPAHTGDYAGTVIVVLLFGIVSVAIKAGKSVLGSHWAAQRAADAVAGTCGRRACQANVPGGLGCVECGPSRPAAPGGGGLAGALLPSWGQLWQGGALSLLLSLSLTLDYFNMLVASECAAGCLHIND
jgi:hypothetical protein